MRVLVTGHEGYIGSVLVPLFSSLGHDVSGLDTGFFCHDLIGRAPDPVPVSRVDLRDIRPEHCQGFEAVVHLAALSNDPLGSVDPNLTYEINYRATLRLARAAKAAGVSRFLFSSSCSLYGAAADGQLLSEDARLAPVTPYGESKAWSERDLAGLADDSFLPVSLRNATAYGFSPRLRGDLVVNDLVARALLTGEVRLMSDGSAWRPLIHVADIAAAFAALLVAPRHQVLASAYNIGSTAENYLIRGVARIVSEMVPGSRVTSSPGPGPDKRSYRVCCDSVARDIPGFRPQWTVRAGVAELVTAYQRCGMTMERFTSGHHQRLRAIEALQAAGRLSHDMRWVTATRRISD